MMNRLHINISLPTMTNTKKILISISRQLIKLKLYIIQKKKPNHLTAVVVMGVKLLQLLPGHPMNLNHHQWQAPVSGQDHEADPGGS